MTIPKQAIYARPSLADAQDALGHLCSEQRHDSSIQSYEPLLSGALLSDTVMKEASADAGNFFTVPHAKEEIQYFRRCLAGWVFERVVYIALAREQPPTRTLLSPQRTLEFYKTLYPQMPLSQSYRLVSIDSISVPDGLIVSDDAEARILAVTEYTLNRNERNLLGKHTGFSVSREAYPKIFADSRLLFAVPKGTNLRTVSRRSRVTRKEMPFGRGEFEDFMHNFIYRDRVNRQTSGASILPEQIEHVSYSSTRK